MTYLPKTFSLKTTGERLTETMNTHVTAMEKLNTELNSLTKSYTGELLKSWKNDIYSKINAQKDKTLARIDEIEKIALENIRLPLVYMEASNIVPNDLMLLDDKIFPVDQNVFDRLIKTYKDNFPMMQALCKYAADHADESLDFSDKTKAGIIKFDFPPTMEAMTNLMTATTAMCRNIVKNSSSSNPTALLGYGISTSFGNIKKMISMG